MPDLLDLAEQRFGKSFGADSDNVLGECRTVTDAGAGGRYPHWSIRSAWQAAHDRSRSVAAYLRSPGFAKAVREQSAVSFSSGASVLPAAFGAIGRKGGAGCARQVGALAPVMNNGVRRLH